MKRKIFIIMLALMLAVFLSLISSFSAASKLVRGDADGNRKVEIVDAVVIQRVLAEMRADYDGSICIRADVDGSGELEVTDATWIQRYIADMDIPVPVGELFTPAHTNPG